MKKNMMFLGMLLVVLCTSKSVYADYLTGNLISGQYTTFTTQTPSGSATAYVGHINTTNLTTDHQFTTFCGDYFTSTSSDFGNTGKGQAYGAYSLWDDGLTIYTGEQKDSISKVFGYLYGTCFDAETGAMTDKTVSIAMQLVIWEILSETNDTFSLTEGTYSIKNTGLTVEQNTILTNAESFLNMLITDDWGDLIFTDYDMTVYVAEGGMLASQTLISIENTAVPEPASMLIFGIGLACGVPALCRRMKKARKNEA